MIFDCLGASFEVPFFCAKNYFKDILKINGYIYTTYCFYMYICRVIKNTVK